MNQADEKEINLKQLYIVIKKRIWVMILTTVILTALGGYYVSIPRIPLYESSTRLYLQVTPELLNNLKVILREPVVLEKVREQLGLSSRSAEAIRSQIRITAVDGSTVLQLSVIDQDPVLAANIANAVVTAYKEVSRNTAFSTNIIVLTMAEAKENPIPLNAKSNLAIYAGFIAGILLGIGVIFLLDSLDDSVKSEREIEQLLGITVLGNVSRIKRRDISKKSTLLKNMSIRGETIGS